MSNRHELRTAPVEDIPQVSFTFLVDAPDLKTIKAIAKDEDRTAGSVLREFVRSCLKQRSRRD